jgi:integrase
MVRGGVSKSRKSALLPLSHAPEILEMLRKRQKKALLFSVNEKRMNEALKRGSEKYGWTGKKITNHSLRHIFACNCAKNGMPVAELCRLMRHESIEITNKYYLHYNVRELSKSLHQHHDLMKGCQSTLELFQQAREAFEASGIVADGRFIYEPEISANELVLRIRIRD